MVALSSISLREHSYPNQMAVWQTFLQVLAASGLIALCSQIKIVLPFTPVPMTLQTLAVLLIGSTLGSRKGSWAVLLYFAGILTGLPIVAAGISNPLVFFGPTGGYALGFYPQVFLMGWMMEKMPWSNSSNLFIAGLCACSIQMALGIWILANFVGWSHVWAQGLLPFLPGEILKVLFVSGGSWLLSQRSFLIPILALLRYLAR